MGGQESDEHVAIEPALGSLRDSEKNAFEVVHQVQRRVRQLLTWLRVQGLRLGFLDPEAKANSLILTRNWSEQTDLRIRRQLRGDSPLWNDDAGPLLDPLGDQPPVAELIRRFPA